MRVISVSYGNDSCAMVAWFAERGLMEIVAYIDTGWAGEGWHEHVAKREQWARSLGFKTVRISPEVQFAELMRLKKGFPNQRFQWCSALLKGLPFLNWLDEIDPSCEARVYVGKRRVESKDRAQTPWRVRSEYHGDRWLCHPLYKHDTTMRDALLKRHGLSVLPHRSYECHPCVNANTLDFRNLTEADITKVERLESDVGKTMFRPNRHAGAVGIRQVIDWAKYSQGQYNPDQIDLFDLGCGSPFGCGL